MSEEIAAQQEGARAVTEDELAKIWQHPALFVNRSFVSPIGTNVRISFGEDSAGQPLAVRAAVVMSVADFMALHELMKQIMEHVAVIPLPHPPESQNG